MSEIKSKKIKTKNIKDSLEKYASDNLVSVNKCDFEIEEIASYIKTSADNSFKLFNEDINEHYKDKDIIANLHVEFKQVFIITISYNPDKEIKLKHSIDYGDNSISPKLLISQDSKIPYKKYPIREFYALLLREVNKIKAKNGILVNIFDTLMIKNLKVLAKHIYAGKFKKRVKISLFDGLDPELARESKLIMWFEQKDPEKHRIIEVEEGEILVEFKKPIYGKNGLNAFGKQIDSYGGKNDDDLQSKIDPLSIDIVENDDKKIYRSKIKGYVHYSDEVLTVDNKVKMAKISRVQASLAKDEDNNIEVTVSQNDTNQDSVGEGVALTSETIHITGHIGAHSVIEAVNLQIDGATHQHSTQYAKFATINRHKGTLRCHKAKIKLLEGGEVHATEADIESSLGGTIYAQDVKIGLVKSNLKVYASHSITIKHVTGEDNLFKINYKDIPVQNSKVNFLSKEISDLQEDLEEAKKHSNEKIPQIKNNIQKRKDERHAIQTSTNDAKITIERPLRGLNVINFTLQNSDEIIYKTDAKNYEPFYLEFTEEKVILHPVNKVFALNSL